MEKLRTKVLGSLLVHMSYPIWMCILGAYYEVPSENPSLLEKIIYNDNMFINFLESISVVYIFVFLFYFIKPLKEKGDKITFWVYNAIFSLFLFQGYIVELVLWIKDKV